MKVYRPDWRPEPFRPGHIARGGALPYVGYRRAKLTPEQVIEIRASDEPATELAKRYPVNADQIRLVQKRRAWREIE